jgi:predicted AAA+ superfamily ATPase
LQEKFIDLLRQYYYVGGMPEAVQQYVDTGALKDVRAIQKSILKGYELDFSKHAPTEQVERIRLVWNSVPSQLFKENKKFIYGALRKGARANEYEMAIRWLIDAGLIYKVPKCTKPELPLPIFEDLSAFKLYMTDLGLLGAMVDTDPAQVLVKTNIFGEFKGGLTEQYVLQQLVSKGVSPIYYHATNDSRLEIDFVIQRGANVLPIEVKAEGNVRANSLTKLLAANPTMHAERYSMLPYKEQGALTNIPLYCV